MDSDTVDSQIDITEKFKPFGWIAYFLLYLKILYLVTADQILGFALGF